MQCNGIALDSANTLKKSGFIKHDYHIIIIIISSLFIIIIIIISEKVLTFKSDPASVVFVDLLNDHIQLHSGHVRLDLSYDLLIWWWSKCWFERIWLLWGLRYWCSHAVPCRTVWRLASARPSSESNYLSKVSLCRIQWKKKFCKMAEMGSSPVSRLLHLGTWRQSGKPDDGCQAWWWSLSRWWWWWITWEKSRLSSLMSMSTNSIMASSKSALFGLKDDNDDTTWLNDDNHKNGRNDDAWCRQRQEAVQLTQPSNRPHLHLYLCNCICVFVFVHFCNCVCISSSPCRFSKSSYVFLRISIVSISRPVSF